ncbi:NAD kinase [Kytococcus sp. HMSC28H12]|uniref:NAD kinase n=1 Tax=Kytococcus sp. HMSC28H12 TaxID=1581067 RepID=UPI0008A49ACD|nr:NAD kinase [Kytococcus sp. HMSC28H12]OFS14221.1 NAD kinase [Kytococcus sp. HMSC28H12]
MTAHSSSDALGADQPRVVVLCAHPGRRDAVGVAVQVARLLGERGLVVAVPPDQVEALRAQADSPMEELGEQHRPELVVVLGGDGTILRGAAVAKEYDVPLLGVNLGHVGFLAEAEREDVELTVEHIVERSYSVEHRMALDVAVYVEGERTATGWALNEATVEKGSRERMVELALEVDGRPLATWGCDGIIMATPTGSTAYAFSAGGPVVWPNVEAILTVPISAHALFSRPLVLGPTTELAVEVVTESPGIGVLWCDGRAVSDLPPGARVEVSRSAHPVRLARPASSPFTDRLVRKFGLSVEGWRGTARSRARGLDVGTEEGTHR